MPVASNALRYSEMRQFIVRNDFLVVPKRASRNALPCNALPLRDSRRKAAFRSIWPISEYLVVFG